MDLLRLTIFVLISFEISYQVSGESPKRNQYKFNNYVCDVYSNENENDSSTPVLHGKYDVIDPDDIDYMEDNIDDDVEFEYGLNELDHGIFIIIPDKEKKFILAPNKNEVKRDSEEVNLEEDMVAEESVVHERFENISRLNETTNHEISNNSFYYDDSNTNKTKREGTEYSDENNFISSNDDMYSFTFDDFDMSDDIDVNTLSRFRDYVLMHLDRRNRNDKKVEQKINEVNEVENENDGPQTHHNNRQNSNFLSDMLHNYFGGEDDPSQKNDEDIEDEPDDSTQNPIKNTFRSRFISRDSMKIETGPCSAKITLSGRTHQLENPKAFVIDNNNKVKDFNGLSIIDQHSVLEDSMQNCNLYLCYPAKVKVRENPDDLIELAMTKSVVKNLLDRCAESFFDTNVGRLYAKRFSNAIAT